MSLTRPMSRLRLFGILLAAALLIFWPVLAGAQINGMGPGDASSDRQGTRSALTGPISSVPEQPVTLTATPLVPDLSRVVATTGLSAQDGAPRLAQVANGNGHSCAVDEGGGVWCWGRNEAGALGLGDTQARPSPTRVPGLTDIVQVTAGTFHSCALGDNGRVWCWGWNQGGYLGLGDTDNRMRPAQLPDLTGVTGIVTGRTHSCAIMPDRTARCWGSNGNGQLGLGDPRFGDEHVRFATSPTPVPGLTSVTGMALGTHHTCAVRQGGSVSCWGRNSTGQLGVGDESERRTPTAVSGISAVAALTAGQSHTCARTTGGALQCWGYNHSGQIGLGDVQRVLTPTVVPGLSGVRTVAAGDFHSCAVDGTGALYCWGSHVSGAVGIGSAVERTRPVRSPALVAEQRPAFIAGGYNTSCATTSVGALWCWGANYYGELGLGATSQREACPRLVPGFGTDPGRRTETALTQARESSIVGQNVRFTATVSTACDAPPGAVSFRRGDVEFARADIEDGVATVLVNDLPVGRHDITAHYLAVAGMQASVSAVLVHTVSGTAPVATTTTLTGPATSTLGQSVSFTATATTAGGATPGGAVSFRRGGTQFATGTLNAQGVVTIATTALPAGTHQITAHYLGAAGFQPSVSTALTHVVTAAAPPPPNDRFATRAAIPGPGTVTGSNAGATAEPGQPTILGQDNRPLVWWSFTPTQGGMVTIDTEGSDFDTILAVFTGTALGNLRQVAVNDDAPGLGRQSRVTLEVTAGTPYQIAVTGARGETGNIRLTIAFVDPVGFIGGGVVFGQTAQCGPVLGAQPHAVTIRYSPSELGGLPSGVSITWPEGSEHLALWGAMASGGDFFGGAGRGTWTRFVFYPTRPLIRVVRRIVTQPAGAELARAEELFLRLRIQNFAATPGCSVTLTAALRREV